MKKYLLAKLCLKSSKLKTHGHSCFVSQKRKFSSSTHNQGTNGMALLGHLGQCTYPKVRLVNGDNNSTNLINIIGKTHKENACKILNILSRI